MLRHCGWGVCTLAVVLAYAAAASATPTYALTKLLPAGDSWGLAAAVGAGGDVVGYCGTDTTDMSVNVAHGMLYTKSGGAQDLGLVPASAFTNVPSGGVISVGGTSFASVAVVAGTGHLLIGGDVSYGYSNVGGGGQCSAPFLLDYDPATKAKNWFVVTSQYNGGNYVYNNTGIWTSVNANGQMAGVGERADQLFTPFVWNMTTKVQTDLSTLPGLKPNGNTPSSSGWAIDSAGDAVGRAYPSDNSTGLHAILYVAASNSIVDFGPNTGGLQMGIYRNGNNIYVTGSSFSPTQQAVWTYNVAASRLTMNGLGAAGQLTGINGSLTAVGSGGVWYNATTPGVTQTSLYSSSVVLNLGSSNWASLSTPRSINDAGQIAGSGTDAAGTPQGFLLTPALAGDANLDGAVNINDLNRVLTNYDKTDLWWADGDFDGNGTLDVGDLNKVLTNYNVTYGSAAGRTAVPEPSTLALVAASLLALFVYARRTRK